MTVSVLESKDVNISCTSIGSPVPIIIWMINNLPISFIQTDQITQPTTTTGNVISTLHIVDAQYPTHDGVYTCTGNNSMDASDNTSIVNITVQVQGITELL